jgi:hypothetical protein
MLHKPQKTCVIFLRIQTLVVSASKMDMLTFLCKTEHKDGNAWYSNVYDEDNSKINIRLVGKKKRVVIAPKRKLSSNK